MTYTTDDRLRAIKRVGVSLAKIQAHHRLPVQLPDGSFPVVVALPTDTLSQVQELVARSGSANVFVAYDDRMTVIAFRAGAAETPAEFTVNVNPGSDADMLVQLLQANAGRGMHISIEEAGYATPEATVAEFSYAA